MELVSIPLAVFESDAYLSLTYGDRQLLVELYVIHGDSMRFTINGRDSLTYWRMPNAKLYGRVARLVEAGLLIVDGKQNKQTRIFRFKYPPFEMKRAA